MNPRVAILDPLLPIASGDRVVTVLGCGRWPNEDMYINLDKPQTHDDIEIENADLPGAENDHAGAPCLCRLGPMGDLDRTGMPATP